MSEDEKLLNEAIKLIKYLNEEFLEVEGSGLGFIPYVLESCGFDFRILFCGHVVFRLDDDERDFDEEKNEYESLRDFVLKISSEILFVLNAGIKRCKKDD